MRDKLLNTFEGDDAGLDFLNPENAPYTPLVEIPSSLNPYKVKGVRIFAKLMNTLPLANVKSLPAYNMLLDRKENGGLNGIDTVIENSSGNTVFSLAVIARLMGIPNTKAVVSHEVTKGKLNLLRFLGTEVIVNEEPICPDPSDPTSGIYKSKVWAKENNWFNPGQYDNEANPAAHYKWTGPQIWEQTNGKVSLLSVGLGTTGSIVGLGRFLKEQNEKIEIVGVSRIPNNPVPGVRTSNLLKEIAFDWRSNMNHHEEVGTVESFRKSMELCRAGILAGPSSGFALVGLLNHLSKQDLSSKEEKIAVFICPDSPFPYVDEYFEFLEEKEFPKIQNEELLKGHQPLASKQIENHSMIKEMEPQEVFSLVFFESPEAVWSKVRAEEDVLINDEYRIIDVRTDSEYEDHHIPNSEHVAFQDIDTFLKEDKELRKSKGVIFVCRRGNTSRLAAYKAEQLGIKAINLKGGDTEWSRLNLPRIRSASCLLKYNL
jgi:cysteine synthase/rhodanese-related sulfurtransferase